jgi:sugar lactone lactonase YvrE
MTAEQVLDAADIVGESLVYDERQYALLWVDIGGKRIHRLFLDSRRHELWPAPDLPTSIPCGRRARSAGQSAQRGARRTRRGLLGGTMQNNLHPGGSPKDIARNSGAVYRIDLDGRVTRMTPREFGITNTMVWAENGLFITADTLRNEIYAYDFRNGELSGKRVFAAKVDRGAPDGSCLGADGRLWNCRVGGGASVACFRRDGTLDRLVELPCSWPTSCAFGGPDFATLYVTSARFTMTRQHVAARPQEGGLFALDVGAGACPEHRLA